jgi:hypothetical protein
MEKKLVSLLLGLILLIGLSGCADYKAYRLRHHRDDSVCPLPSAENESVGFTYRVFSKRDCLKYLDRNVIAQGYQPVQITIQNNSSHALYFSARTISLVTVESYEVARSVHTNTLGRVLGYGIPGLFFCPFLLIPAIVDGTGSANANNRLDIDFDRKSLHDQLIGPFESINGLIFVPIELFSYDFNITMSKSGGSQPIVLSTTRPYAKVF